MFCSLLQESVREFRNRSHALFLMCKGHMESVSGQISRKLMIDKKCERRYYNDIKIISL